MERRGGFIATLSRTLSLSFFEEVEELEPKGTEPCK